MSIKEKEDKAILFMNSLTDWSLKYTWLSDVGRAMLPSEGKKYNRVYGCHNNTCVHLSINAQGLCILGYSDSNIVSGIIKIFMMDIYQNQYIEDVINFKPRWMQDTGIDYNVSIHRTAGMALLTNHIVRYCLERQ